MSGIPLEKSKWDWLKQNFPYEIAVAAITCITAISRLIADKKADFWWLIGLTLVFAITAVKNIVQWQSKKKETSCHELEGCLFTLHGLLMASRGADEPDPKLRITLHVPIEEGQRLQQLLDYVGDGRTKKTAGRKFLANCGAIGNALRLKSPIDGQRASDNYEEYIKDLIENQGFTEHDARETNRDTMAWMAVPFFLEGNDDKIEAVLYLDSTDRNFFTSGRKETIIYSCSGIARFVKRRYYKV